jgi:hypothetical protein
MVKLEILLDEPSIDLSNYSDRTSVPLSGKLVLSAERPVQIRYIALKYDCINSHIDLEVNPGIF